MPVSQLTPCKSEAYYKSPPRSPFVKIRRKGQKFPKWEKILSLPDFPQISPFHLLTAYVAQTRFQGKPGGPVLLSLNAPFKALVADSVGPSPRKPCRTSVSTSNVLVQIRPGGQESG